MKLSPQITRIATVSGLFLGAFALAVVAQTAGTWTAPTASPPGDNVPAPINVGGGGPVGSLQRYDQYKSGLLGLKDAVIENLTVSTGTPTTVGQVLTAVDTQGTVGWRDVSGLGDGSTGGSGSIRSGRVCGSFSGKKVYFDPPFSSGVVPTVVTTPTDSDDRAASEYHGVIGIDNIGFIPQSGGTWHARCIDWIATNINFTRIDIASLITSFTNTSFTTFSYNNGIITATKSPSGGVGGGRAYSNTIAVDVNKEYTFSYDLIRNSGTYPNIYYVTGTSPNFTIQNTIRNKDLLIEGGDSGTFTPSVSGGRIMFSVDDVANFTVSDMTLYLVN